MNMKNLLMAMLFACPVASMAQIGLKAGLNFTDVTNASSISNSSSSGFNVGVFYSTPYSKIIGSKTELVFSRQGYNYSTGTITGKVNLDYIMLPQYLCINITRFFQVQVGFQLAYLLNAKTDSTSSTPNPLSGTQYGQLVDYYNRFAYGIGGGVEVHPIEGLLVGVRINISLNDLYKVPDVNSTGTPPSFVPDVNVKANLFQIYAGWRFGK
jgi:hypothetical protein